MGEGGGGWGRRVGEGGEGLTDWSNFNKYLTGARIISCGSCGLQLRNVW